MILDDNYNHVESASVFARMERNREDIIREQRYPADKDYFENKTWQCKRSDTGAHHYIEKQGVYSKLTHVMFICKFCSAVKITHMSYGRPKGFEYYKSLQKWIDAQKGGDVEEILEGSLIQKGD